MERYLINYLKENTSDEICKKYIDFFKCEMDWFIYNYGEHISRYISRKGKKIGVISKQILNTLILFQKVKTFKDKINILSGNHLIKKIYLWNLGFNPLSSIFQPLGKRQIIGDTMSIKLDERIRKAIYWDSFRDLYNKDLFLELEENQKNIIKQFKEFNIRALLLWNAQYFSSKYLIDISKQIGIPSMVFSHGLPGIYSKEIDNRTDFLMVWGERIKENYVRCGIEPTKIFITGNPKYKYINIPKTLRNSLNNILIIPPASAMYHQTEWGTPVLMDRSSIILYLFQVQKVLQEVGVTSAKVRPHPNMNKPWVFQFLDTSFYKLDNDPLLESLDNSSLVIGSTSTVFLESLLTGVNYLIFEPQENGISLMNSRVVSPFDGTDGIEVARDINELKYLILHKYQADPNILNLYMQPLNLNILKQLIKL
jgi:hypothetical protein